MDSLRSTLLEVTIRCFTDSRVTLYWIQGVDKNWKPFIRNRVAEIRHKLTPECWNHCSGRTNPADLPSRGISLNELSVSKLWQHGPDWLPVVVLSEDEPEATVLRMPEECIPELKITGQYTCTCAMLMTTQQPTISRVLRCEEYSSLSCLMRVTALVLQAGERFMGRFDKDSDDPPLLSPTELAHAERLWIVDAQSTLSSDSNFPSWQIQFNLFTDSQGLWRCGGRLTNANLPYASKHPLLLPRDHHLTVLIVRDAHNRVGHNGVKETLTELRRKFWVIKGRSFVHFLIHRCVVCRRFEGVHYRVPPPPPLPMFRNKEEPPFTCTGVDFAGPLHVHPFSLSKSSKVWIVLFTCLTTRAVHLDTVIDLTAEAFIRSLKRFAGRRSLPGMFLSDNGKTFKAAASFVKAIFKDATVQEYLAGQGVKWKFNIEKAPWWGGAFERLVKSTKRCLRKMVGRAKLSG